MPGPVQQQWFRSGAILGVALLAPVLGLTARTEALPPGEQVRSVGVPDYTRITGEYEGLVLPLTEPKTLWRAVPEFRDLKGQLRSSGLSDAVVADGVVYFGAEPGSLIALNCADGSQVWEHQHGARIAVMPGVDRQHVYFGSQDGITALHRDTGEVVWQFAIEHGAGECTPLPVGKRVYVAGYDGHAYALSQATGEEIWKHDFLSDAPADPPAPEFDAKKARFQEIAARPNGAACDGKLFIQCVFDQSRVIALDCETGERRWTFQAQGWISPAPTIVGDHVYVASQDKHLYCLNRATGALLWKFQAPNWLASRVAVHDGQVFLPNHGGKLFQLDARDGKLIRMFEPPDEDDRKGMVYSFPIIAGRTAYFCGGSSGVLFAVDIDTARQRWRFEPVEQAELFSNPATDGQRIFVVSRRRDEKTGENALIAIGE